MPLIYKSLAQGQFLKGGRLLFVGSNKSHVFTSLNKCVWSINFGSAWSHVGGRSAGMKDVRMYAVSDWNGNELWVFLLMPLPYLILSHFPGIWVWTWSELIHLDRIYLKFALNVALYCAGALMFHQWNSQQLSFHGCGISILMC